MKNPERNLHNECHHCKSRQEVPGDAHIMCINPDPDMTGDEHGIQKGWFYYPMLFDPTWKTKLCSNYELNPVVSSAVSQETQEHTS